VTAARAELATLPKRDDAASVQACSAEELLVTQPIFR
jgi:acid phosphatase (class A)